LIKKLESIEQQVLKKISPTEQERKRIKKIVSELIKEIKQEIKKFDIKLSIELVGSIVKDTYLKNNMDIDLFILFPVNVSRKKLQQTGLSIGRAILENQEECFAEHPYVRGTFQAIKTEIVPCYCIASAEQKISAVDRTPLHTKYIKKHLLQTQKKEVMLLKQFLRGIGCYGAGAEVEGFSGYLCEILIIKYGSFQKLIVNAQNWKYGHKIKFTDEKTPDFDTPLVFIDPVDSQRNVSSAVSEKKFNFFIKACIEYVSKPSLTFFFPREIKPWPLKKIYNKIGKKQFIAVKIKKPSIISENLYPQIRKSVRSITELCERYDFKILDYNFFIDKQDIYMILLPKKHKISQKKIHMGPPIKMKKNVKEFVNRWNNNRRTLNQPYEKNGRLYVEIKREYWDIEKLIEEQINNLSLGKHLDKIVKDNFDVIRNDELIIEPLRIFWTEYLDEKMPWER